MKAKYRADRKVWVAHTRFRDFDGVTRLVQRVGRSQTAALAALQDDIRKRIGSPANPLRPTDTFERAANLWLAKLDAQVAEGARAATTADTYRQRFHSVILPRWGSGACVSARSRGWTRSSQDWLQHRARSRGRQFGRSCR
jgi:hypothetical protein